jgi:hypothetical protein
MSAILPTKAAFAFLHADALAEAGHQVPIFLRQNPRAMNAATNTMATTSAISAWLIT